jgi:hypothetical protein
MYNMTRSETLRRKRQALANFEDTRDNAKASIKVLKREIAELEAKPALPTPREDVIRFNKQFVKYGTIYKYAAIRSGNRWYLTGAQSPQNLTWDQLAEFIEKDNNLIVGYRNLSPDNHILVTAR